MKLKKQFTLLLVLLILGTSLVNGQRRQQKPDVENTKQSPSSIEVVTPIHKNEFRKADFKQRVQGGKPRMVNGYLQFDGAMDGNRQVDPQIAVGGGYVFHGTNSGLTIYDKDGNFIDGVSQKAFANGIDPKDFLRPTQPGFWFRLMGVLG